MPILHKLTNQSQRVVTTMKLYSAFQLVCHTRQTFQPSVEARLELRSRRNSHHDASQGVEGLHQPRHDDLAVQSIDQTLMKLPPEFLRHLRVRVHANDDFAGTKLLKSVLDAIGDVHRNAYLGLHSHIRPGCVATHLLEQALAFLLVGAHVLIFVHHIEGRQRSVQFLVPHQEGQIHQMVGIFGIFYGNQHVFIVLIRSLYGGHVLVAKRNLLRRMFGYQRRDDTGKQNHEHHPIEQIIIDEVDTGGCFNLHSHHHHGNGASRMGRGEAEHHRSG